MQKIPLNLAQAGMMLAKAVSRPDGMAVAAAGTELTDTLLERFDAMGVTHVEVDGRPVGLDGAQTSSFCATRLEHLPFLFRKYPNDPWMGQLHRYLAQYFRVKAASCAVLAKTADAAPGPENAATDEDA